MVCDIVTTFIDRRKNGVEKELHLLLGWYHIRQNEKTIPLMQIDDC